MASPPKPTAVLIVEDEPLVRFCAVQTVEEAGFDVIEAANADEAIAILESRQDIRVVFTDIHMPGSMDGLKLAHAVRDRWPPIKIIVTSGRGGGRPGGFAGRWPFLRQALRSGGDKRHIAGLGAVRSGT